MKLIPISGYSNATGEEARQKVIQDCGMVMGGNVHSTLPDEEINWAFSTHPEVRTGRITVQEEQTK